MAKTTEAKKTETNASAPSAGLKGLFAYWAPPILVGLAIGLAAVGIYKYGGIGRSEVDEIVERWEWGLVDENSKLADEITRLGATSRGDVIQAFRDVSDSHMDLKVWVASLLTKEPFFDTKFLTDEARGGSGAERRAAAVALAAHLREDADPDVVMPGIMDWLKDLTRDDQKAPIGALADLGPLTSDWQERAREALLTLARKRPPVADDPDEDFVPEVREDAIALGLHTLLGSGDDAEIVDLLHEVIADDTDEFGPRVSAVRALSENGILRNLEAWTAASQATSEVVRQAVAENLFRAEDRAFGAVLEPMHLDAHAYVRTGSIDAQVARRQPTMMSVIDQLLEDEDLWVRFAALHACAVFRNEPGTGARNGQLLRIFANSDEAADVEGAVLALHTITGKVFGFREVDLHHYVQQVEETALEAFMKDAEGRAAAVQSYREAFGGTAVWTDDDRAAALRKLLEHKDPDNQARAKRLLGTE